jgi:hypothetical protein
MRARAQQAGLDIVAATGDQGAVEVRPQRRFGDAGPQLGLHGGDRRFGEPQRDADHVDLAGDLDAPCLLERDLSVDDIEAGPIERQYGAGCRRLDADTTPEDAMPDDELFDLGHKGLQEALVLVSGIERHDGLRRADLVDRGEIGRQMLAGPVFEQDHWSFDRYEQIACRIAGGIDLHVPGAAGIANVDRIKQDHGGHPVRRGLFPDPREARGLDAPDDIRRDVGERIRRKRRRHGHFRFRSRSPSWRRCVPVSATRWSSVPWSVADRHPQLKALPPERDPHRAPP